MDKAIEEIVEELRYFERLVTESEERLKLKEGEDGVLVNAAHRAWMVGYRDTLRHLFDVCEEIQRRSKRESNLYHLEVYKMREDAWKLLRAIYLQIC